MALSEDQLKVLVSGTPLKYDAGDNIFHTIANVEYVSPVVNDKTEREQNIPGLFWVQVKSIQKRGSLFHARVGDLIRAGAKELSFTQKE